MGKSLSSKAKGGKAAAAQQSPAPAANKAAAAAEEETLFEQNEGVLARDSGELYEAKVLRVSEATATTPRQYFIHYQGWNSKWDKWVDGDALLKDTPENRKLQAQLKEMKQAAKKRPNAGAAAASSSANVSVASGAGGAGEASVAASSRGGSKNKKEAAVQAPPDPDIVEDGSNDPQVKLAMPFTLKKQLVDDWEKVTRDPHQLVPLPRTPSAATVLQQFVQAKQEKEGTSALQLKRYQELMEGIRLYFDKALPLILLYRQEREQYERAKKAFGTGAKGEFRPSDIYGPEHLLRLFVRLPHLLAQAPMTQQEATQVQAKLGDLLKFLQRQHQELFLQVYTRTGEDSITPPSTAADEMGGEKGEGTSSEAGAEPAAMEVEN